MYELVMFANTKAYSDFAMDDLRKAPRIRVMLRVVLRMMLDIS
jgi:hypothetical protein